MATIDSSHRFKQEIDTFLQLSDHVGDTWCLKSLDKDDHSSYYLCRTSNITVQKYSTCEGAANQGCSSLEDDLDLEIECDNLEPNDQHIVHATASDISLKLEHHIVYSPSYSVPVLYFNCYRANGSLLTLEELWETVPALYQARLANERWATLTQAQHPLLGFPFYQLHPCHTADLMSSLRGKCGSNYIMSWLSAVGPLVHVHLSVDYVKASEKFLEG